MLPPELPPPPPWIPRGKLWLTLLAPPVFGGLGVLTVFCCKPVNNLLVNNLLLAWLLVGIVSLVGFIVLLVKRRFVPHVTVLLIFGYLIGEAVLCFGVFFGGCVLSFNLHP